MGLELVEVFDVEHVRDNDGSRLDRGIIDDNL